jgi:C4-dicarboxylate-specific signal transduction histidine kinase
MKERVLLVEDNRALAENVAEILRDEGLLVSVCHDADTAEAEAMRNGFELAIVDIRLAGADVGLDLVPRLQRISIHSEVLLITGNASLDSAIGAIRRGVYAYLIKPFEPDHLIALVKRALAQVALKRDRQALSQRLAASEALYRSVVESVESCILGLDAQGAVRFHNRFAVERLVVAHVPLLGATFESLCTPEDQLGMKHSLRKALAGSPVRDHECSVIVGGRPRRIRWTITPLAALNLKEAQQNEQAPPSELPVLLAAGIDITDKLELQRKTAEAEAMAAMGTLTTALAHEIRNPLNAAKLQLELLTRRAKKLANAEAREVLAEPAEVVRTEINRLASLLDEFLDLARPRQIERQVLQVRELFDEVSKLQAPVLEHYKVALTMHIEPADLTVRGDHDKLKQVLINLVVNAIEALQETSGPRIELSAQREGQRVSLCVRDNGPGVPVDLLGSAFTPFVTSKPSGTGLGLAIVQKIARQHGGVAELVAQTRGTLARLEIPD